MKKIILSLLFVASNILLSKADVSEYSFSQQNSTYTEITGGTVLWSGTFDNDVSEAITIPTFNFNKTDYTSINISTNGFITFGSATTATTYTPISSTATYSGAIAAFGVNIVQAESGIPSIRYEQIGNEFVIQWKDIRRTTSSGEIISCQIRLNTSNNNISIVYGGTINPGNYSTYPQVGLRGTSNSDYNNRRILSAGGNWINSTSGTSSSYTMYFNSTTPTVVPTEGLTFKWKPVYNPSDFTATAVSLDQIDLNWAINMYGNNILVAYNTITTFGTPINGSSYSAGNLITGGGTVIYNGSSTTFSHIGLSSGTLYYYKIWSYDTDIDYSTGSTGNTRTGYSIPYLRDFNTSPSEWTLSGFSRTTNHGTSGSYGLGSHLSSSSGSSALSPLIGSISADTYLSFHYRIVENSGYPVYSTTLGSEDKIEIQVSTDDGATYSTINTINNASHTPSVEFNNKMINLAAYNGDFIRIRFLCTWGSGDYYVDIDNFLIEDGTNMSYTSSTSNQPNTSNLAINSMNNEILCLGVVTQKNISPLSVTSITFNTTGSTSPTTDISSAKVYYTTTQEFSSITQFGSTLNDPTGTFTIPGSQALAQGNNYFWLVFDIKSTATAGNVVDAQCTKFLVSDSGVEKAPTTTSPVGSRIIGELISGTRIVPDDYPTIAAAVDALNNGVIGSGGVTINVTAGHTETSSSNIILSATGNVSNPIIFQKSGSGDNPKITRTDAGSVSTSTLGYHGDGVLIIQGSDYVTFNGIDVAADNQGIEYGYYLRKGSTTNACKNVSIKNCNINMTKGSSKVAAGFCAGNNSSTASSIDILNNDGSHENISFTGNTITDVFSGIVLIGDISYYDKNFVIGSSGNGNTIENFAGNSATESYGIYLKNNDGSQISYNYINNMSGGGSAFTAIGSGIYNANTTELDFYAGFNNINLTSGSFGIYGIYNSTTGELTITDNTIAILNTTSNSNTFAFIYNSQPSVSTSSNTYITNNIFASSEINSTGSKYLIYNNASRKSPEATTISGNSTSGTINCTAASGSFALYYNFSAATGTESIYNNNFSNINLTGTTYFWGIYTSTSTEHTQNVYNNTISNITCGTYESYAINLLKANNRNIYGNNIHSITAGGIISGIISDVSNQTHIYKNAVYDISSSYSTTSTGYVNGIVVSAGTSVYLYNNFISDLKAPSSGSSDAIRGISLTSSTANSSIGVYYNTIYLDATSSGTNFGTSGLYQAASSTSTTAALDLRNNIIVNNSTQNGTYSSTAFRRSSSYLDNYSSSSNNNVFYAGTPGTYNLICNINSCQTIEQFKSTVGPTRDNLSFSELPVFINPTTAPYNLRLQDGITSFCESGGLPISSPINITDDFDGAGRPSTPDIGADEFSGISSYVEPPASFATTVLNSQEVNLTFTSNEDEDNVVIVYNPTGTFTNPTGTPVAGESLAGGTILYYGSSSPQMHTSLSPNIKVYYKAFCYDGSNYSTGITADATPQVTPPTVFTATKDGTSTIDLKWTKNDFEHDIIIAANSSYMNGNPTNGVAYNVGDAIPSGGTVIYKGSLKDFSHTGLSVWTQYYYKCWSVDEYNYYSTSATDNEITDAYPVTELPYLQNFDGTWSHSPSAPENWLVVDDGSGTFTWINSTTYNSPFHSARAYESGNCDDYIISPPIVLPAINARLSWYEKASNASYNSTYKVMLSATDNATTSFTTELGSYDCTNTEWTQHNIDLSSYSGQTIYVAFYLNYSESSTYTMYIDDILIDTYIPAAVEVTFPTDGLLTFVNPRLEWIPPTTAVPVTGYRVYLDNNPDPSTLIYTGSDTWFQTSGLTNNTSYFWKVVPYNDYGDAVNVPVMAFSTVSSTQLAENFEEDFFPPVSWSIQSNWLSTSTASLSGNQSARNYTFTTVSRLITPLLDIQAGDKFEFFEGTSTSAFQRIQIMYSSDKTSWTNLGSEIPVTVSDWGFHSIDLSSLAGNNYYLAIGTYYITGGASQYVFIDHVTGPGVIPILPLAAINPTPENEKIFNPINLTLSWNPDNDGGIPTGYEVYMDTNPNPTTNVGDESNTSFEVSSLEYNTTYYWKVVPYNSQGFAASPEVWSFTTIPEGGVLIGTGDAEYLELPVYPNYGYNYSQIIYLQSEINTSGKRISKISFHWNGADTGDTFKDWTIYMGHTTKTAFASLTDWVPTSSLTQVFSGVVTIHATDSWVEITLDTPFEFNNTNNLLIAVDENTEGFSDEYSPIFYGTDDLAYRGIHFYSDDTNPNPASPPAADALEYGYANIMIQTEDIPTIPIFRVFPESKDFGTLLLGDISETQSFIIQNNGVGTLQVSGVSLTGTDNTQFHLFDPNTYPVSLGAGESISVSVYFFPLSDGAKNATLVVTHDRVGSPANVALTGEGNDVTINSYPFTETFETSSTTRNNWFQIQETGTGLWTFATGSGDGGAIDAAYNGTFNARFTATENLKISKIVSPILNLTGVSNPQLIFWYGQQSWGTINELKVFYRTDIDETWVQLFHDNTEKYVWTRQIINLPNASSTYQIAFEGTDNYGYANVLDDITVQSASSITWIGGVSSDWNTAANWSTGVVPNGETNVVIPNVTNKPVVNQESSSPAQCNDLTINSGAILTIAPDKGLTVNGLLNNQNGNGGLIIQSDINGTGKLINNTDGVPATIQQYFIEDQWHYYTIPVTGSVTADPLFLDFWLIQHDESEPAGVLWNYLEEEDILTSGNGYGAQFSSETEVDKTIIVTGNLVANDLVVNCFHTDSDHGWNLIGNPYPCTIDWEILKLRGLLNISDGIYLWDPTLNAGEGNYATWVFGASTNGQSQFIAPMQGFFVLSYFPGSITFSNECKVTVESEFKSEILHSLIRIELSDNENRIDETVIRVNKDASHSFDDHFDARKMKATTSLSPQIYSLYNGKEFSINTIPSITNKLTIPLETMIKTRGYHSLKLSELAMYDLPYNIYLEDLSNNEVINLSENNLYSFNVNEPCVRNFNLIFTDATGYDDILAGKIKSLEGDMKIIIKGLQNENNQILVSNISGQTIFSSKCSNPYIEIPVYKKGIYIVKVTSFNGKIYNGKVMIK